MTNIHACLVHEEPDCVADLVANLRHFDPDSLVLLYDGSEGQRLPARARWSRATAYWCTRDPSPDVVGDGCTASPSTACGTRWSPPTSRSMTIVDSDQLLVAGRGHFDRHWLACIASAASRGDVGCLVSQRRRHPAARHPQRAGQHGLARVRPVAAVPAPVRATASGTGRRGRSGRHRFHPRGCRRPGRDGRATRSCRRCSRRTRLWATEELVLPTLVALRGHRVAPTPFCDDLVRFRVRWTASTSAVAAQQPDLFWVHPVPRRLDDPVRAWLRRRSAAQRLPGPAATPHRRTQPADVTARRCSSRRGCSGRSSALDGRLTTGGRRPPDGRRAPGARRRRRLRTRSPRMVGLVRPHDATCIDAVDPGRGPDGTRRSRSGEGRQAPDRRRLAVLGATRRLRGRRHGRTPRSRLACAPALSWPSAGTRPRTRGLSEFVDHLVASGRPRVGRLGRLARRDPARAARSAWPRCGPVLDEMDAVDGWLSRDEAAYLALLAADAVRVAPAGRRGRGRQLLRSRHRGAGPRPRRRRPGARPGARGRHLRRRRRLRARPACTTGSRPGSGSRRPASAVGLAAGCVRTGDAAPSSPGTSPSRCCWSTGWHDYASVRADVDCFAPSVVRRRDRRVPRPRRLRPGRGAGCSPSWSAPVDWERCRPDRHPRRRPTHAALRADADATGGHCAPSTCPAGASSTAEPCPVSCLMPTRDRPALVRFALTTFARQDLAERELVVVDDGDEPVDDLVAGRPARGLHRAAAAADASAPSATWQPRPRRGRYLAHWDDDDWYAPHRLSHAACGPDGRRSRGRRRLPALLGAGRASGPGATPTRMHDRVLGPRRHAAAGAVAVEVAPLPRPQPRPRHRWLALAARRRRFSSTTSPSYVGLMHPGNTSRKNTARRAGASCRPTTSTPWWATRWRGGARRVHRHWPMPMTDDTVWPFWEGPQLPYIELCAETDPRPRAAGPADSTPRRSPRCEPTDVDLRTSSSTTRPTTSAPTCCAPTAACGSMRTASSSRRSKPFLDALRICDYIGYREDSYRRLPARPDGRPRRRPHHQPSLRQVSPSSRPRRPRPRVARPLVVADEPVAGRGGLAGLPPARPPHHRPHRLAATTTTSSSSAPTPARGALRRTRPLLHALQLHDPRLVQRAQPRRDTYRLHLPVLPLPACPCRRCVRVTPTARWPRRRPKEGPTSARGLRPDCDD